MKLTNAEESELIRLLSKLSRVQPWSSLVYHSLALLQPQIAIEMIAVRKRRTRYEVLLFKRPPTDPYYSSYWHIPGTILRNREPISMAFRRLKIQEFNVPYLRLPKFLFCEEFPRREKRSHFLALVYVVQLKKDSLRGKYFSFQKLPKKLAAYHGHILPRVHTWLHGHIDFFDK